MTVTADAIENIAVDGLVDLPELARVSGVSRDAIAWAITEGLTTPSPVRRGRGRGGAVTFTKDEALFLLAVAALAIAAGVAFVTMLKAMKANGAKLSGNAVTLTIPSLGGAAA